MKVHSYPEIFIDACLRLGTSAPSHQALADVTGIHRKSWQRQFRNPVFLIQLKSLLDHKKNYAKTKEKKLMYQYMINAVADNINALY